jgi:hypothetical protein
MIVILYDPESNTTHEIAKKIRTGIEHENKTCILMDLADVDLNTLISAKAIVFGCHAGFLSGVSQSMVKFMNYTKTDIFENQNFKNKFAAGFTTRQGCDSTGVIEDICAFSAKHSMIWISQGNIAENEGADHIEINRNRSYLGCISSWNDVTPIFFGRRIAQVCFNL